MARRSDHKREELKEIILGKAWDIVEKEGFLSLSARRIAKEIGYSQGTIYNIFDSMDDLYLQLNAMTLDMMFDVLSDQKQYNKKAKLVDNLKTMASLYQEFVKQNKNHWLMLFANTVFEVVNASEWYQGKVDKLFLPLEMMLEDAIKQKRKSNIKIIARTLWASVHGIVLLNNSGRLYVVSDGKEAKVMTDTLIENFVRGVE